MYETPQPQPEAAKESAELASTRAKILDIPVVVCSVDNEVPQFFIEEEPTNEALSEIYDRILARGTATDAKLKDEEKSYTHHTVRSYLGAAEHSHMSEAYLLIYHAVEQAYQVFQSLLETYPQGEESSVILVRSVETEMKELKKLREWMRRNPSEVVAPKILKQYLRERLAVIQLADADGKIPLEKIQLFKQMVEREPKITVYE